MSTNPLNQLPSTLGQLKQVALDFAAGTITPKPKVVPISITNGEQALWTVNGGVKLSSITFSESPFDGPITIHPDKKLASSTVVTNPKHKDRKFKYTVVVEDAVGKKYELDPDVHVMP